MMLRRFDPDQLRQAKSDPKLLGDLVEASSGYVLQKMRQEGLMPSLEILMACPSADSLSFILDHYELDREQRVVLAPFFQRETGNERLAGGVWDEARIERALLSAEPLPKTAALSVDLLMRHPQAIEKQAEFGEYEFENMLTRSVQALSLKEFMRLDRGMLVSNHYLFEACNRHYHDNEFKRLAKDLGKEASAGRGGLLRLENYSSWPFGPEDKDFLAALLAERCVEPRRCLDWANVKALHGAEELIGREEFFDRFNPRDIDMFSTEEVVANKGRIQASWLGQIQAEDYGRISRLVSFKCLAQSFALVFDEDFAKRVLDLPGSTLDFSSAWQDDYESKKKLWSMKAAVSKAAAAEPERYVEKMGVYALGHIARDVLSDRRSNFEPGEKEEADAYGRLIVSSFMPIILRSREPSFHDMASAANLWTGKELGLYVGEWMMVHPSANALRMLSKSWSKHASYGGWEEKRVAKDIEELAARIAGDIDPRAARMIMAEAGMPLPAQQRGLLGMGLELHAKWRAEKQEDEYNFLAIPSAELPSLSSELLLMIALTDDGFISKFKASKARPPEDLLLSLLDNGAERQIKMLAELVAQHELHAMGMASFAPKLLAHKDASKVVDVAKWSTPPSWSSVEDALGELRAAAEATEVAKSFLPKKVEPSQNYRYNDDDDDDDDDEESNHEGAQKDVSMDHAKHRVKQLAEVKKKLGKRVADALVAMPHALVEKNMKEMVDKGRFADMEALIQNRFHRSIDIDIDALLRGKVEALARMDLHESLEEQGEDARALRAFIVRSVDYNGTSAMSLDAGSVEKNTRLASALMPLFGENPTKVFAVFAASAAASFSNEFAIEHFAHLIPYSYTLAPVGEDRISRGEDKYIVKRPYTNEQMIKMWDRMDQGSGFFCDTDVNADYGHFVSANFKGDSKRYLACLEMAKSRPKLYCVLFNSQLSEEFAQEQVQLEQEKKGLTKKGGKKKDGQEQERLTRDELAMRFNTSHIDWAVVRQGMSEIFEEMANRDGEPGFSRKIANKAIDHALWQTYAEVEKGQAPMERLSALTQEQSHDMLAMICAKAPMRVYEISKLGVFDSVSARIASHAPLYFGEDAVERFVFPPDAHMVEHYSLEQRFASYAKDIGLGLAHWMLAGDRREDAKFLDWWIKESSFRDSELVYGERMSRAGGWNYYGGVVNFLAKDPEVSQLLSVVFERMSLQDCAVDPSARRRKVSRL
jgi:hypothetical protein